MLQCSMMRGSRVYCPRRVLYKKQKCHAFAGDVRDMAFYIGKKQEKGSYTMEKMHLSWDELKLNSDGMLTVVVQEADTDEVLMVAYMNREAYEMTLKTGKMTYWSRSRNELWVKGLTSGHFQYVRGLYIDCDRDTLLAKVEQVGAACHTGAHSCFFTEIE